MKWKTENVLLWVFLLASLSTILLVKFIFAEVPDCWQYGHEVGEIFYDLSLAIITSIIFYYVVVVIPQNRNRKNIYKHAGRITDNIIYSGSGILDGLSSHREFEKTDTDRTEEEFFLLCKQIGPNSLQDYFSTTTKQYPITYGQHISHVKKKLKEEARNLFVYMVYLDTEHIKLVNEIIHCPLMEREAYFDENSTYYLNESNFESISDILYDFYKKVRALRTYLGKESLFHNVFKRRK